MGQAVGLKKAKRMLTPWGEEVKSFSHMKHDFGDVETFYLDTSKSKSIPQRSNSDSNLRGAALDSSLRIKIPDDNRNKFSPE
ncbi:hypothetical protein JTE90_004628 [Oedothorax gibbosus]|uniref:Uncharacterized protein n=1 Tax=Oedothorax gibbosus TaxID=931172 RepID=A0AAV6UQ56_9ARAC|nr:hypothetical protein JTE90_004628 [Oedothorax gibbosus]